jgi:pyruvate dehydrogenase E1 component alpha subunit
MGMSVTQQLESYRRMLRIRKFEEEATRLTEEEGLIPGGIHSSIGQEAAIVGACMALRDKDYITGTHRSHGHPIGKGADLRPLVAELLGKATGICKGRGGSMHLADRKVGIIGESAIVGGGIPLAIGAALSIQVRGTDQVSLGFFGDGAANQGTFGESLNLAAIWKLPAVFFCENNLYAISTPSREAHGHPDIARRGEAYGVPGVIVDGQDVTAVYETTREAVERARTGGGPTLIEAKTYRFGEHCTGLHIPIPYRTAEEVNTYRQRDPVALHRAVMLRNGVSAADVVSLEQEVAIAVREAVAFARESPWPEPSELYDDMFSHPIHYPPATKA